MSRFCTLSPATTASIARAVRRSVGTLTMRHHISLCSDIGLSTMAEFFRHRDMPASWAKAGSTTNAVAVAASYDHNVAALLNTYDITSRSVTRREC